MPSKTNNELSKTYTIEQLNNGILSTVEDTVICEYSLDIYVDDTEKVSLLCSPTLLDELRIGYLFCAGHIENPAEPVKSSADIFTEDIFTNEEILSQINAFSEKSALFSLTGGAHSAAICDKGGIICFAEDISRQSALLKVIGVAVKDSLALNDKMLLTSGRVSTEVVDKAIHGGFPLLVSRSAPTDAAIELARQHGLKLVGFARGQRMNIYS